MWISHPQGVSPIEPPGHADPLDYLCQALAVHEFHRRPAVAAGLAGSIERDQVRVTQRQHRLHGPHEALHLVLVFGEIRLQYLESDGAVILGVARPEDDP